MSRQVKEKQKAVYNPAANYVWKADDLFQISGLEIEKINRALQAASSGPEFQKFMNVFEGLAAFQNFFKECVEDGLIVEKKDEEKQVENLPKTVDEAVVVEAE